MGILPDERKSVSVPIVLGPSCLTAWRPSTSDRLTLANTEKAQAGKLKAAPLRSAPWKSASLRLAPQRLAPLRSARLRLALVRLAFMRLALVRLALVRLAPSRLAPTRSSAISRARRNLFQLASPLVPSSGRKNSEALEVGVEVRRFKVGLAEVSLREVGRA